MLKTAFLTGWKLHHVHLKFIFVCFLEGRLFKGLLFVKNEGCVGMGILFCYAKKYEKMK